MNQIPADVESAARELAILWTVPENENRMTKDIARVIMVERERCAKIAWDAAYEAGRNCTLNVFAHEIADETYKAITGNDPQPDAE
jgi:hypothetical protein